MRQRVRLLPGRTGPGGSNSEGPQGSGHGFPSPTLPVPECLNWGGGRRSPQRPLPPPNRRSTVVREPSPGGSVTKRALEVGVFSLPVEELPPPAPSLFPPLHPPPSRPPPPDPQWRDGGKGPTRCTTPESLVAKSPSQSSSERRNLRGSRINLRFRAWKDWVSHRWRDGP